MDQISSHPTLRRFYWRWERALTQALIPRAGHGATAPGHALPGGGQAESVPRILCAVSGGCDSVTLARLLRASQDGGLCRLTLAHVNHALRPEAGEEEVFVRRLASRWGLDIHVAQTDPSELARKRGWSLEHAARVTRFEALERMARAADCPVIALGHQMDDQAETLLLRILRGTGPRGLGAMEPRTELPSQRGDCSARILIRPLLDFRRRELREFAQLAQLDWMEDASNRDLSLLRNRIRSELMPLLTRDYNPRLVEALAALARLQRAESEPVAHMAQELERQVLLSEEGGQSPEEAVQRLTLDAAELAGHPEALITRVLWRTYQKIAGPEATLGTRHMEALLGLVAKCRDRSASEVHLPGRVRARLDDGKMLLEFHNPRHAGEDGEESP